VSVFDFCQFDPESYADNNPLGTWHEFVPFRRVWGCAVWIEIDRTKAAHNFISGRDLIARWKEEEAYHHTVMPYIEAAYIGELPQTAFARAFLVRGGEETIREL
jgi:hypothetical protein